jgi:hypothetical protein
MFLTEPKHANFSLDSLNVRPATAKSVSMVGALILIVMLVARLAGQHPTTSLLSWHVRTDNSEVVGCWSAPRAPLGIPNHETVNPGTSGTGGTSSGTRVNLGNACNQGPITTAIKDKANPTDSDYTQIWGPTIQQGTNSFVANVYGGQFWVWSKSSNEQAVWDSQEHGINCFVVPFLGGESLAGTLLCGRGVTYDANL